MILHVYVDPETERRLKKVSRDTDRTIEDLAECAIAEAALDATRHERAK